MVLGTVSVIGGLSVLMLPETGSHLSDTLEEIEECIRYGPIKSRVEVSFIFLKLLFIYFLF